jgi:hypothetical protein
MRRYCDDEKIIIDNLMYLQVYVDVYEKVESSKIIHRNFVYFNINIFRQEMGKQKVRNGIESSY